MKYFVCKFLPLLKVMLLFIETKIIVLKVFCLSEVSVLLKNSDLYKC